jgi:hypothetical protein
LETSDLPDATPAVFPAVGAHVTDEPPPPVVQNVCFEVAFVGFIPACDPAFWLALPFVGADGVADAEPDFFPCPWCPLPPPPLVAVLEDVSCPDPFVEVA